ncbi:MAG: hypothetical protein WCJ30_04210, partial [Deltaproteobacteria bacterium]
MEDLATSAEVTVGQMDLFGDRWLRAAAAHKALEVFDLEAATVALRGAEGLYPTDASLLERTERVASLAAALREAQRRTGICSFFRGDAPSRRRPHP